MKITNILAPSDVAFTLLGSIQLLAWHYFLCFLCSHTIQQAIVNQQICKTVVVQHKVLPDLFSLQPFKINSRQLNDETQQNIKNMGIDFMCAAAIWLALPMIYAVLFICLNEAANLTQHKIRSILLLTLVYGCYTILNLYQKLMSENFILEKWWVLVVEIISTLALLVFVALQSQNQNSKKFSSL